MNCPLCNRELRIVPEQVSVDSNGIPVYHRIAYCDYCRKKADLDGSNNNLTGNNSQNVQYQKNTVNQNNRNNENSKAPKQQNIFLRAVLTIAGIILAFFIVDSVFPTKSENKNSDVENVDSEEIENTSEEDTKVNDKESNEDKRPDISIAESLKDMRVGDIGYVDDIYVGLSYVKKMNYLPTALGENTDIGEGNEVILGFFDFYNSSDEKEYVNPSDITCYVDGVQVEDVEDNYIKVVCDGIRQYSNIYMDDNTQMISVQDFAVPSGWNEIKFYFESECVWTISPDDVMTDDYEFSSMYDLDIQRDLVEEDTIIYQGDYEVIYKGVSDYTYSSVYGDEKYVAFKFTINNTGEETIDYSFAGFEMAAYQNNYYLGDADYVLDNKIDDFSNIFNIDTIEPGMTTNIYIAFESFVSDGDLYMIYDDGYINNKVKGSVFVKR